MLQKFQNDNPVDEDYRCDNCQTNKSTKQDLITHISNILIIHLKMFRYTRKNGVNKIIQKLRIEEEISLFAEYWTKFFTK